MKKQQKEKLFFSLTTTKLMVITIELTLEFWCYNKYEIFEFINHSVCALQEIKKQLEEEESLESSVVTPSSIYLSKNKIMNTEEEDVKPFREKVSIKV
jgi:hypothetical protein